MRALHGTPVLLAGAALIVAVHPALVFGGVLPLENGGRWDALWDPDSYARLLRVEQLLNGGGWWNPRLDRLAPPEGMPIHWTRLLDLVLLAGALPLVPALGWAKAVLWFGIVLGPLLHLAGLPLLSWASRPALSDRGFLVAAAAYALMRPLLNVFMAGQIDHHGLLALLTLAMMACLLRGRPTLAGGLVGLAVWASPEGLVVAAVPVLWLGIEWLLGRRDAAAALLAFTTGMTLATWAALVVERPPRQWLVPDLDRLSVAQAGIAAVLLAGAAALGRIPDRLGDAARGWAAAAIALSGLAVLALLFPGLVGDPYDQVSDTVRRQIVDHINAERPFLPRTPGHAYWFLIDLGPMLLPALWLPLALRRGAGKNAPRLRLQLLALLIFCAYAVARMRGATYVGIVAALPLAEAAVVLARRHLALAVVGVGWFVAAALGIERLALDRPARWVVDRPCAFEAVAPFLDGPPGAVFTDIWSGPELAWRTARPSMAGPYHVAAAAIGDVARALESVDDGDARAVMRKHGVRYVVLCRRNSPYPGETLQQHPDWLATRLFLDRVPGWLAPVPLPAELAAGFLVLRVR